MIDTLKAYYHQGVDWAVSQFGSSLQMQVVLVLASILALDAADKGALSVTAVQIQNYFHISKTAFGVLGSITTGVGAIATLPFGILVDRTKRTKLLAWSIGIWAFAMILSGSAPNYAFLIGSRVMLGVITAVAYPAIASLLGDYFMPGNRGRAYGWVLSGEILGTGLGIVLSGGASSIFSSWRAAEFILLIPAAVVLWAVLKLPEPARGITERKAQEQGMSARQRAKKNKEDNPIYAMIAAENIKPRSHLVLKKDPQSMNLWQAIKYVLSIKTNIVIIAAGALGYFFFTGLRFFAIQFVQEHYHLSHTGASGLLIIIGIGAIAGVIASGRVSDWWLRKGHYNARVFIPAVTYFIAAVLIALGVYTSNIGLAVLAFMAGGFFFEASNPPLDAARLDIMLPTLWGRAESTRTVFIGTIEAIAPVSFGLVADQAFGGNLEYTFLVMLIPLLISSSVLYLAVKTYGRDVATMSETIDNLVSEPA